MILRDDHDADWTAAADSTLERRVYSAQNWRADVVALMADNGRVLERTWHEAYGTPHSSPAVDLSGTAYTFSQCILLNPSRVLALWPLPVSPVK